MPLDNAIAIEVQANGGAANARSGGPGASFMPKLGRKQFSEAAMEAWSLRDTLGLHSPARCVEGTGIRHTSEMAGWASQPLGSGRLARRCRCEPTSGTAAQDAAQAIGARSAG
jgi:hypothetical protein